MKSYLKNLALAGLSLAISTSVRADLIVDESFSYPGQSDNTPLNGGFNGGTGLAGSWQGNGTFRSQGLTFSDLLVSGGCMGNTGNERYYRQLNVSKTGVLWGSFLFKSEGAVDDSTTLLSHMVCKEPNGNDYNAFTGFGVTPKRYAGTSCEVRLGGSSNVPVGFSNSDGVSVAQGTTYLVLFKVENLVAYTGETTSQTITSWILNTSQYVYFKSNGITEVELNAASQGANADNVTQRTALTSNQRASFSPSDFLTVQSNNTGNFLNDEFRFSDSSLAEVTPSGPQVANIGEFGPGAVVGPVVNGAASISWSVPAGTDVTNLLATYTYSPGSNCPLWSGTTQNFTNPVVYTLTSANGQVQISYTVTVTVQGSGSGFDSWPKSASFFIQTTPDGANVTSGPPEVDFPVLLRLNNGNFNFAEAQPDGRDIRFSTASGEQLAYQIEQWDRSAGAAAIWIKVPTINPNSRQELKIYWGNSNATSESSGTSVFNTYNGFVAVMHLDEPLVDSVGTVTLANLYTSGAKSLIGNGRLFGRGSGINCGTDIETLPSGGGPHTTEVWFRSPNSGFDIFDWGNEYDGKKVQIRLVSPPRLLVDGNFAGVQSSNIISTSEWHHVVNTYTPGDSGGSGISRLYIDGKLDASEYAGVFMAQKLIMRLGGWYDGYSFSGEMDEARLSKVARSANWIKLEYENQRSEQTLLGNLVQPGNAFDVTPASANIMEGATTTLTAQAGGAQRVSWIEKRNGRETTIATDTFAIPVTGSRITGTESYIIQFKAMYDGVARTIDIPITVVEKLPDPSFALSGPSTWDGRQTITVRPEISNFASLQAEGVANMSYNWTIDGCAVTRTITPGTSASPGSITLTRSQGSGPMTVTLTLDNGGARITQTMTIFVTEPATDPFVIRTPGADEIPVTGQFYARNPETNLGMIHYNGSQGGAPNSVFLKVYTTETGSDVLYDTYTQGLDAERYQFSAPITPGLKKYKVEYGTTSGGVDTVVNTVTDLVCGDAYIFAGQSNAWATDGLPQNLSNDPWVRSYAHNVRDGWGYAVRSGSDGNGKDYTVGYFAYELALSLKNQHQMPICIINGARGGTRIDQHQPNPAGHNVYAWGQYEIYPTLLNRIDNAKLTHGIRGAFWHQGESNSGSGDGSGDFDYKSYQKYFVSMSAAWKQDYPNLERYIVYQVMPAPCSMGPVGDQLRDVQRTLPLLYSKMDILTALGNPGYEGCHFSAAGYKELADLTLPVANHRYYGIVPPAQVTSPILKRAHFTSADRTSIALVFDQPISWNDYFRSLCFVNDAGGLVTSGSASGSVVTLQLNGAAPVATELDYLQDSRGYYSPGSLLRGTNNVAALTFADVAVGPAIPLDLIANAGGSQVTLSWTASADATGYNIQRSIVDGGPYVKIGSSTDTSYVDTTATNGTTYHYVVSATLNSGASGDSNQASATPDGEVSAYIAWANHTLQGLTVGVNDGAMSDPDRDGMNNLMEFALGSSPTVSSPTMLPRLTKSGGSWVYEYKRNDASVTPATAQVIEYGSDLTGWTAVDVPSSTSGIFTITNGSPSDTVKVTIPQGGASMFIRLKVTQP